jgi:DNA-binding GntR family transcriptional regulator
MAQWSKDQIYASLFSKIVDGKIPEQVRLKEEELAEEYQVSRSPIREILQLLSQDGLIELLPNRGARAKSLTADDIEEIYEIRMQLEPLALEHAIPRIELRRLQEFHSQMHEGGVCDDAVKASELDRDFHTYLIEASDKKRLINMLNQLLRLIMNFRYRGFHDPAIARRVMQEHSALIDVLIVRDTEKAKRLLIEHLDNSKNATLKFLFDRDRAD